MKPNLKGLNSMKKKYGIGIIPEKNFTGEVSLNYAVN